MKNNESFCGLWEIAFVPPGPREVALIQSDYLAVCADLFIGDGLSGRWSLGLQLPAAICLSIPVSKMTLRSLCSL